MKYPVFALFALALLTLASCQNTPSTPTSNTDSSSSSIKPIPVSNEAPASDVKKLNAQILTDMVTARKELNTLAPEHQATFEFIKTMKMSWANQADAEKAQIQKLVDEAWLFWRTYGEIKECTDKLESLTTYLDAGTARIEDIQKEYVSIRDQMKAASGRLPSEHNKMLSAKSEWERDFPGVGKGQ